MGTVAVRLSDELEEVLDNVAKETGRTKTYYMRRAIKEFLEDREDYLECVAILEEKNPSTPFDVIRKKLGLDRKVRQKSKKTI